MINTYDITSSVLSGLFAGYCLSRVVHSELNKTYLAKIADLSARVEKLEEFRFSLYEKNLLLGEKREWDEISTEESDQLTDIDDEIEEDIE